MKLRIKTVLEYNQTVWQNTKYDSKTGAYFLSEMESIRHLAVSQEQGWIGPFCGGNLESF